MIVLLLNQDYSPLTTCTVQRAFLLIYLGKAELIASDKSRSLRSVTRSFDYPSVIKVKSYVSVPYKGVVLTRNNIFKRDRHECQYCGTKKDLTIDHVIPRSKGGKSTWTNLVTACKKCNAKKSNFSIEKVGLKLANYPVKPTYVSFLRISHGKLREDWKPFLNSKKAS